mmetsp:Transcript_5613/g.18907  ORF Transcript_5613/g.18907 Transcript_5613/m.18907 type:complete len:140 (-) Transcript_5613:90-509(-)
MTISASIVSFSPNARSMMASLSSRKSSSSYKNKSSSSSIINNNYTSPMTLHHHRTTSFFFKRQRNEKVSTVMVRAENKGDEEPKLTRKKEAETEAFLSPAEKSGENPLKDPMAIIGIVGIVGVPALILLVGVTSGYIGQ